MKNKMKNNEKLARNTIRARKAAKKRSNEQTTQTRCKRWQSRLFALVGCILLVSALVVPCFADYSNGSFDPVIDTVSPPEAVETTTRESIDLSGYCRLDFTTASVGNDALVAAGISSAGDYDLATFFANTPAYFGYFEGVYELWGISRFYLTVTSASGGLSGRLRADRVTGSGSPMDFENILWVPNYPFEIANTSIARSIWSSIEFTATQYTGSVVPEETTPVPDTPVTPPAPITPGWVIPTQKPVDGFDVEVYYDRTTQTVETSLMGYYELVLTSLDYEVTNGQTIQCIEVPDNKQAYFGFTDGRDDKFYQISTVQYGSSIGDGIVRIYSVADLQNGTTIDLLVSIDDVAFYIPVYPDSTVLNETVFTASGTNYTVSKLVYPFTPDKVSTIWTDIMTWITSALASIQSVFYLNGSLTFLGTLSIIGVSIALAWLIIGVVIRFFQLRG